MKNEKENGVTLLYPVYFYIKGRLGIVRYIVKNPVPLCIIDDSLFVIIAYFNNDGVVLPIKETKEDLDKNNIKYKIHDNIKPGYTERFP